MTEVRKAEIMMAVCAIMWSISGIFIKLISWNPLLIAGGRSVFAALVMFLFMRFAKIKINVCKYSIGAGLALTGVLVCFVTANKLTTAANAIVLQYTAPIFILIISMVFLHHKVQKKEVAVVAVTAIGIVLFFFDELTLGNIAGNIIAIMAGLFLGIMFTIIGFGGGKDDSIRLSGILFGHILTSIVGIAFGLPGTESFTGQEFFYLAILGVIQLGIPYVLYALASAHCPPLACSLIGMLEPILNPVWVFIFAGEAPGLFAFIGAIVVIGAVTYWCLADDSQQDAS